MHNYSSNTTDSDERVVKYATGIKPPNAPRKTAINEDRTIKTITLKDESKDFLNAIISAREKQ